MDRLSVRTPGSGGPLIAAKPRALAPPTSPSG
jgi:hypothetical protein